MNEHEEFRVVYENGVLRPESPLRLPEHARFVASLRPVDRTTESPSAFARRLSELRGKAELRTGGWRFDRDQLYDRH